MQERRESKGRKVAIGGMAVGLVCLLVALTTTQDLEAFRRSMQFEAKLSTRLGLTVPNVIDSTISVERKLSLYKRTYTSLHPADDGAFLQKVLGLEVATEQIEDLGNISCADREVLSTLDRFQLHFFHSYVYPGRERADGWMQRWSDKHKELSTTHWDAFTLPSVTLYTPMISPFLRRLENEKVRHIRYYQLRKSKTDTTLYSILINVPYAGVTIEVISDEVLTPNDSKTFSLPTQAMCPESLVLEQEPIELFDVWKLMSGKYSNDYGLPDLLVASLSYPVSTTTSFSTFFTNVFGGVGISPQTKYHESSSCDIWTAELAVTTDVQGTTYANPVYLRAVANRAADDPTSDYSLLAFEKSVNETHADNMKPSHPNAGWDAFIDMHPGLHMDIDLDGLPELLRQHGYGYTMHPQCLHFCGGGSIWATGISPWSIEIQGFFSSAQSGEINSCSLIDYCSSTSNGDTSLNTDIVIYKNQNATDPAS